MNRVCLITALASESAPCLAHFRLKRISNTPQVLYESQNCLLLQTGIGKLKAAAGVAALLATHPDISALINIGICGAKQAIGTPLLASEVIDVGTGRRWYPHLPARRILPDVQHQALHCLDQASSHYQDGIMFDMESAGIVQAASQTLDLSRVHCLKVVSDSPTQSIDSISKSDVQLLIESAIPSIDALLNWQQALPSMGIEGLESCHSELLQGRHCTVSESHALRRLLERHVAITGSLPDTTAFSEDRKIRDVNTSLIHQIESQSITY